MDKDKSEFFEKIKEILNFYMDEYEYAKIEMKMKVHPHYYKFKSSILVDDLCQWLESRKMEWQKEVERELWTDIMGLAQLGDSLWAKPKSYQNAVKNIFKGIKFRNSDLTGK